MGRPPKPTALKRLAGNPGKRKLNDLEPEPRREMPGCPRWLTGEAKKEWRRMARDLYDAGLLTTVDRAALAGYCVAWATFYEAQTELQKTGVSMVIMTSNGNAVMNPWLGVRNRALDEMRRFLVEFGMTPASRSRVKRAETNEEQSLADILFAGVTEDA